MTEEQQPTQPTIPAAEEDLTGKIVEGTVSGITSFGAFVKLENNIDGLVHISEIADSYVKNVADFVNLGDKVKVKVLGKNKKGKYDLSIKQVEGNKPPAAAATPMGYPGGYQRRGGYGGGRGKREKPAPNSFEDKIDQFLKRSDEKQLDLKRNIQGKQGVKKRKKMV